MKRKIEKSVTPGKRRIAAYVRVSTMRQKMEGDSLEAQQNAIKKYIEYRIKETDVRRKLHQKQAEFKALLGELMR